MKAFNRLTVLYFKIIWILIFCDYFFRLRPIVRILATYLFQSGMNTFILIQINGKPIQYDSLMNEKFVRFFVFFIDTYPL